MRVNLNADLGEAAHVSDIAGDIAMLKIVGSANIACGWHAGNADIMRHIVRAAQENHVSIGAHPGYPDRAGFGRQPMHYPPEEIQNMVLYQVGALQAIAASEGGSVSHVKAHGALYNQACEDDAMASAIVAALGVLDCELILLAPAGSAMARAARESGQRFAAEVFADRSYEADGSLTPRNEPGALINDPELAAERALDMVMNQSITSRDGVVIDQPVDSICVHGDTPDAARIAGAIRARLLKARVELADLPAVVSAKRRL